MKLLTVQQWKQMQKQATAKRKPKNDHLEDDLQMACVRWYRMQYSAYEKLLFSIPNGAMLAGDKLQRIKRWQRLAKAGALAGVADLFLSVPSKDAHGLYIEIKTTKGQQTKAQKEFQKAVELVGYRYVICRSFEDFKKVIANHFFNLNHQKHE